MLEWLRFHKTEHRGGMLWNNASNALTAPRISTDRPTGPVGTLSQDRLGSLGLLSEVVLELRGGGRGGGGYVAGHRHLK